MTTENESNLLYNGMGKSRWTQQELEILHANVESKLISDLQKLLPGRSRWSILSKIKHSGIAIPKEELLRRMRLGRTLVGKDNFKVDQSITLEDLDNKVLQVLLGSMLGDGCSNKQSANLKNYRFIESHSVQQREYVTWKSGVLEIFRPRVYVRDKWQRVDLITLTHPVFNLIRGKFYKAEDSRKSIIPADLMVKLDLLGFLVWFLDDGNFTSHPNIGAKGWEQQSLVALVDIINDKLNSSVYIYKCKHYNGVNQLVKIPHKDWWIFDEWARIANEVGIPSCMQYKLRKKVYHSDRA